MSKRVVVVKQEIDKIAITSGRGVPQAVLERNAAAKASSARTKVEATAGTPKATSKFQALLDEPYKAFSVADTAATPQVSEFSMLLNLDEYDFPDEDEIDPHNLDVNLDVTALDRYNDDVRKHRHNLLETCRLLPLAGEVEIHLLERIRIEAQGLSRSCYYGTPKAQNLAEGSSLILIWLLNRRNVPIMFLMRILQSVAEMVWSSSLLKKALVSGHGIKVIARLLKSGIMYHANLGCWAAYALLATCIGCGEAIAVAQDFKDIDEFVGEITFPYYWIDWPANFGTILQGLLFGPHSVTPIDDELTFL